MPDKVTKRSRAVGSRKPGRPPKNKQPTPTPTPASDWTQDTSQPDWGSEFDKGMGTMTLPQSNLSSGNALSGEGLKGANAPMAYTGIEQVAHGLTFPTFDPNSYFPSDIFNDTSALEGIDKADADVAVHSIERKRQRMRVVLANQGLMQDIIRGGMEHRKIEGMAIDYDKLKIDNETKFINWQTAGLNRDIAINKFHQTGEKLIQGGKILNGMRNLTSLIDEEWQARYALKTSSIADLKTKAMKGASAMDARLSATVDTISASDYED